MFRYDPDLPTPARGAWENTLRAEGRSAKEINTMYRKGALQYHGQLQITRGAPSSIQQPTSAALRKVNPFGAFQSNPFGDDAEGGQAQALHPVPRWLY